ncbi:hypothetical protein BBL_3801 [Burkholderia pseudomallei MSHR1328]|nr:hypothetical protein BBL_3801 [Burkholderia pseudomallei MSHR1328]
MKIAPDITSASLFASRMRLPARAAARLGASPAAPTIAATTVSQPSLFDTSTSACLPYATWVRLPAARNCASTRAAVSASPTTATSGAKRRHWATSFSPLRWAVSA